MELNYSIIPLRPAGAGWSSIRDMLKYVQMELNEGTLPDGSRYIKKDTLLARRAPQVPIGKDTTYGMGLMVDTEYGTPVVHHGGDMVGYHSDMMWLPEHNVGAVVLTNADPGWILRTQFRRKLLEVLFDGRPEADADCGRAGQELLRPARRRTKAADGSRARGGRRKAGVALRQRRAGRDHGQPDRSRHGVRFRRVAERGGDPAQPGRLRVVHHHRARASPASSSSSGPGRSRRSSSGTRSTSTCLPPTADVVVEVAAPSSLSGTERIVTDSDRHAISSRNDADRHGMTPMNTEQIEI